VSHLLRATGSGVKVNVKRPLLAALLVGSLSAASLLGPVAIAAGEQVAVDRGDHTSSQRQELETLFGASATPTTDMVSSQE
jgi:hypothetical protein